VAHRRFGRHSCGVKVRMVMGIAAGREMLAWLEENDRKASIERKMCMSRKKA